MMASRLGSVAWRCQRVRMNSALWTSIRWCGESTGVHIPTLGDAKETDHGWLLAYALDGKGGATSINYSDEDGMRNVISSMRGSTGFVQKDPAVGIWIHVCCGNDRTHGWLKRIFGRRIAAQTYSWLVEDLAEAQPTCLVSPSHDALLLTLRVARGLPSGMGKQETQLVTFRLWVMRDIIITARESMSGESVILLPELESQLLEGIGPTSCGALAAAIIGRTMALSMSAAQKAEDQVFLMKERLQVLALGSLAQRQLELLRRELAQVRYNVMLLRRYLLPQQEPLETLLQFCRLPDQNIFNEKAVMLCQKGLERHQMLMERLDGARNGGEALQGEILALIGWGTATATYRLSMLGSVLGLFGFLHVSFDVLNFFERRKIMREQAGVMSV